MEGEVGGTHEAALVSQVMTREVVSVSPTQSVDDALDVLLDLLITGVPVVDESGRCVGVVAESDVLGKRGETIADIMSTDVISVTEDDTLDAAAQVLLARSIHRVPVVKDGKLVGILSRADLLRHVRNTRWMCAWCNRPARGLRPPNACPDCGGETWRLVVEKATTGGPPGAVKGGLEGVIAGTTALCEIDGNRGRLLYRGYDIPDLAEHSTFEETAYLLWYGELPTPEQLGLLKEEFRAHLEPPPAVWEIAKEAPPEADAMDLLRTQVSMLGLLDPDVANNSEEANLRKAARLVAETVTLVATSERIRRGAPPVSPRMDYNLAQNFLYMLRGAPPECDEVHAFDVCLVLHAEHGMNASTFAARVTAGTLADMHAAVTSAIGALKGPLHGGANERVMDLLRELPDVQSIPRRIHDMLNSKKRIMGFGHRVYHTEDPRATILRRYSQQLAERDGETKWYELTRGVEKAVLEAKGLYPNVDLYSASVYTLLGIPQRLFTPVFAVSRMVGWTANIIEQHRDNRLIRPDSEYVGPPPREYTPLERR